MGEAVLDGKGLTIRIRVDAEQATKNVGQLDKQLNAMMLQVQNETRTEALRELSYATSTWTKQPVFKGTVWHRGAVSSVKVSTTNPIFIFVDQGTRPHLIVPKAEGYPLAFQGGYKAKSRIGVTGTGHLRAYKGGAFGDFIRAMHVHHPGTKARKFMEKVQKKAGKWAAKRVRELVRTILAKH